MTIQKQAQGCCETTVVRASEICPAGQLLRAGS